MKGKVTKVIRLVYRNEWSGGIKQLELDSDAIMEGKQDCKFRLVDFFNQYEDDSWWLEDSGTSCH